MSDTNRLIGSTTEPRSNSHDRPCQGQRKARRNSLVRAVDIVNSQNGQIAIISEIAQGDTRPGLEACLLYHFLGDVQGDWYREEVAVRQAEVRHDSGARTGVSLYIVAFFFTTSACDRLDWYRMRPAP